MIEHKIMVKKKIAFIKHGDFSYINKRVIEILQENFPDFEIDIIDIFTELISRKDILSLVYCLKEFGVDILLQKKKINTATYLKLPYIFEKIKMATKQRLAKQDYIFTFQTQSLFDASIPGIPHFVYTDHFLSTHEIRTLWDSLLRSNGSQTACNRY